MNATRFCPLVLVLLLIGCTGVTGDQMLDRYPWKTLTGEPPLVIAHRGNSHDFPEHSYYAYSYAGHVADFIEADVVMTKDGVPICRHDLFLSKTTNIASLPEFADRKRTIDGREDWWAMDLTLADFRKLSAVQRYDHLATEVNTALHIPTLNEAFGIAREAVDKSGIHFRDTDRPLGVYIKIKNPAAHRAAGYDLSRAVLDVIEQQRRKGPLPPIYLQCFDRAEVVRLLDMTDLPVILLSAEPVDLRTLPKGLAGLGLKKELLKLEGSKSAVLDAMHQQGLAVHAWTFRLEALPGEDKPSPHSPVVYKARIAEITPYLLAGVDGVFVDNPSWAAMARLEQIADPEGSHTIVPWNPLRALATWYFWTFKFGGIP